MIWSSSNIRRRRRGATAVEYALIAALVTVISLVGFLALSQDLSRLYDKDESELGQALTP